MAVVEVAATPLQLLAGSGVTLSATFYSDGVPADPGATTVAVTNAAGTTVVASTAAGGSGTARTLTLDAGDTGDLDLLTATWTTTNHGTVTTTHEVVGAFLFTLAEARSFRGAKAGGAPLADAGKFPASAIEEARARITEQFETLAGVSFVPRYRRITTSGSGSALLALDRMQVTAIRGVETRAAGTSDWTAYDADDLADLLLDPWGVVRRETLGTFTSGTRNVRVAFEHGYTAVPLDIKRAALLAATWELVETNASDRATTITTEFGTETLWTPGLSGRGTAIHPLPEVDRILRQYISRTPVVA